MQHGAPVLVPPPRSGGRIVTDCALPSVWHGVLDGCGVLVWPLLPGACVQLPVPLPLPACCGTTHILLVTLVISYFGDFGVSFVSTVAGRYTRRGGPRLSVRSEPLLVLL